MMTAAISATGVRKGFPGKSVLVGLDLEIEAGTVHCLLGENGAGKTTLLSLMSTLTRADGGIIHVLGHDVETAAERIREDICVTGQSAAVDELLTGRENLTMFARLFGLPRPEAARRADTLLTEFGLDGSQRASTYSGGQRRRLDLALSLIRRPKVLFLDEPTTGLDLASRHALWQAVRDVRDAGTTVVLTTQYLEEAAQLADVVSVLHEGTIVATGSPEQLMARIGEERLELVAPGGTVVDARPTDATPESVRTALESLLADQVDPPAEAGLQVRMARPTMDDVYLALTTSHTHTKEAS